VITAYKNANPRKLEVREEKAKNELNIPFIHWESKDIERNSEEMRDQIRNLFKIIKEKV
jgi:hypothetical protein